MSIVPASESELRFGLTVRDKMMYFDPHRNRMLRVFSEDKFENNNPFKWNPIFLRIILEHLAQLPDSSLDSEQPTDFWELVWQGKCDGKIVSTDLPGRNINILNFRRRCIDLFAQNKKILNKIVQHKIGFLHYSGSAGLSDILRYGLIGRKEQKKVGISITPNGIRDSQDSETWVSLDQWHSLDYQNYFDYASTQEGSSLFVTPLTKERLMVAMQQLTRAIERWHKSFDINAMGGGMLIDEFRLNHLRSIYDNYDQILTRIDSELGRTLYVENFPIVLLTQVPKKTVIPFGDILTEVVARNVPIEIIKAVLVPNKFVRVARSAVDASGLRGDIEVFDMETFNCHLYPDMRLD